MSTIKYSGILYDITVSSTNRVQFVSITLTKIHYFSRVMYNSSFVFNKPLTSQKFIVTTLPVYIKYQFKLYPLLSAYSTVYVLRIRLTCFHLCSQIRSCDESFGWLKLCSLSHSTERMDVCTNRTIVNHPGHVMIPLGGYNCAVCHIQLIAWMSARTEQL